jgi:AcrR family transcriptional regulator
MPSPSPRRSQQERSATTRARLVDATVASLIELGYAATTISRVQERAGVARGTLLHHFPHRADLLVAVVEDVASRRLHVLADAPGTGGWDAAVDLVWSDLQSPAFLAVLELWVAARTDPDLHTALVPVERTVFEAVHRAVATMVDDDDPRVPTLVQFTIDLLTGSAMTTLLGAGDGGTQHVVERWRRAIPVLLGRADATDWV